MSNDKAPQWNTLRCHLGGFHGARKCQKNAKCQMPEEQTLNHENTLRLCSGQAKGRKHEKEWFWDVKTVPQRGRVYSLPPT